MESRLVLNDDDGESITITPPSERRSGIFLTRYEVARIVGIRAQEIASGKIYTADPVAVLGGTVAFEDDGVSNGTSATGGLSPLQGPSRSGIRTHRRTQQHGDGELHFIFDVAERATNPLSLAVDPVMMAKHELFGKQIRMIVQRQWPHGRKENIPVSDLEVDETWLDLRY